MEPEDHKVANINSVAPQHAYESEIPPHQGLLRADASLQHPSHQHPNHHSPEGSVIIPVVSKQQELDSPEDEEEDDDDEEPDRKKQKIDEKGKKKKKAGGSGRRRIEIKFIENKSRRQVTFSRRKRGLMKKAYELTTLTGTQALVLIASETGHVYTFATPKLQPVVTLREGKELIQSCLNAPDNNYPPEYAQNAQSQHQGQVTIPKAEPHSHVSPPTSHHTHHDPHIMSPMGYGQSTSLPGIHHGGLQSHHGPSHYPTSIGGYSQHVDHNMGYPMQPPHPHQTHSHHPHPLQMGLGGTGHMSGNPLMQPGLSQHGQGQQKSRNDHLSADPDSRNVSGVPQHPHPNM